MFTTLHSNSPHTRLYNINSMYTHHLYLMFVLINAILQVIHQEVTLPEAGMVLFTLTSENIYMY